MGQRLAVVTLLLLAALAAPAAAQGANKDKKRLAKVAKIAKRLGVPAEPLAAVGGERLASPRAEDRRAVLRDLAAQRPPSLVPVLVELALRDPDADCRVAAIQLFSVLGLDADRELYLRSILPALRPLFADPGERVREAAADEANRLAAWFQHDKEVVGLLEATFRGENRPLAVKAWQGLLALENPELRAGVVLAAMREVQDRKSRFAVFERRTSFRENGRRGGPWTARELAPLVVEDGTVAVATTQSLAELGDPVALPYLRKIDRTAAHVLRIPVLLARGALQDDQLLGLVEETLASDHVNIQVALVAGLAKLKDPAVDPLLVRLAGVAQHDLLRQAVALARLERGDAGGEALLAALLEGEEPDAGVARRILEVDHAAAHGLVLRIASSQAGPLAGPRVQAIARLGDGGIDTEEARALLRKLQEGEPSPLRLAAAASLLQLGAADGADLLQAALKDYDVVNRVDVSTPCGVGRRFNGSPLIGVLRRLSRTQTLAATPVLAAWLDPPDRRPQDAAQPDAPGEAEGTRTRGKDGAAPLTEPAEPPRWLAHPFVRREAVLALGRLVEALEARADTPRDGDDPAALRVLAAQAIAALARALADPQGVVRRAAVQALAPLAQTSLEVGASLTEEEQVRAAVEAWLRSR